MNPVLKVLLWLDIKVLWVATFGRSRPRRDYLQRDHCAQAWQWQRHLYEKE